MKVTIMILPLFALLVACKSPTFTYIKQVDHNLHQLYEFKIDATYSLYTRSICKDSSNFPIDCQGNTARPVEVGYIIISDTLKKALVINNVPNRKQKFFDEDVLFEKAIAADTTFINVFFFKQFRFGTLEDELIRRQMKFMSAEKHRREFLWNYEVKDSLLKIVSVADVVPGGQNIRYTDKSLYLVPTFRQSMHFKFVFQLPSSMTDVVNMNKSAARIFVHKKSKKNYITYIEFKEPIYKEFKAVKFAANRMYAF